MWAAARHNACRPVQPNNRADLSQHLGDAAHPRRSRRRSRRCWARISTGVVGRTPVFRRAKRSAISPRLIR